jgi:hypothetical protein
VDDIQHEHQVRETEHDQLEQPEAEEGEGSKGVEADVGAARLDGVAHKVLLLVPEEGIAREQEDE